MGGEEIEARYQTKSTVTSLKSNLCSAGKFKGLPSWNLYRMIISLVYCVFMLNISRMHGKSRKYRVRLRYVQRIRVKQQRHFDAGHVVINLSKRRELF